MAKELVDAVRKAEMQAEQVKNQALFEAKAIIAEAQKEARSVIDASVAEAEAVTEAAILKANSDSNKLVSDAIKNTENEIAAFNELVNRKKDKVIDFVIENIVI